MRFVIGTRSIRALPLLLSITASLEAQGAKQTTTICVAPPSAQMASGNNLEAANALRDLFASYLTGPTLAVKPLTARLSSQAIEEAKQSGCQYVLFASMKVERNQGNGALGRIVGGAVENSASELRGVASSRAARVAADAAASAAREAARGLATNIRSKDQLTLDYRLETISGRSLVKASEKAKASSDGQDLLTPLVEHAAEAVANAAISSK